MAVSRKGREARRKRREARLRRPNLSRFYGTTVRPVRPGSWDFRIELVRGGRGRPLDITPVTESLDWNDEGSGMTGSIALQRPDPARFSSLPIGLAHRVRLRVRWQGGWYELWQMEVGIPQTDLGEGTVTADLKDDLSRLARSKRDWEFRKTKRRKKGWTAREIVREVARREGIRVGTLAPASKRFRLVKKNATALDVIREAYKRERDHSGRRFIIRVRDGRLEVIALQRNRILYEFREQIERALVEQTQKDRPVTVIEARGRVGKGKDARKVKVTVYDRSIVRRYGRVTKERDYGRVSSRAGLRREAMRDLAKELRVKRTATLTVPGVPFIRRGDTARWRTREHGWYGATEEIRDRSFVTCTTVRHSLASDGYTTELGLSQEDPYAKDAVRLDRERRKKARERRKRKRGS